MRSSCANLSLRLDFDRETDGSVVTLRIEVRSTNSYVLTLPTSERQPCPAIPSRRQYARLGTAR